MCFTSIMGEQLTDEDVYGKNRHFWEFTIVLIIIGLVGLMVLAGHYPLLVEDENEVLWGVIITTYSAFLIPGLWYRRKLIPYSYKTPTGFTTIAIVSLCVVPALFAMNLFIFFNGALDRTAPYDETYSVVEKYPSKHNLKVASDSGAVGFLKVTESYWLSVERGMKVTITLSPGFFNQPWVRSYK